MSQLPRNAAAWVLLVGFASLLLAAVCFFLMLTAIGGCVSGGGCRAQETTLQAFRIAAVIFGAGGMAGVIAGLLGLLWQRLRKHR